MRQEIFFQQIAKQQVLAGEKVKKELDQVNKELLLIGELQLENMRRIETFSASRNNEYEVEELKKACEEEIKAMNQQLEAKVGILEAYKHRVIEMEHIILERDNLILSLKQMIQEVNEQRFEKLEVSCRITEKFNVNTDDNGFSELTH
nr:uncharacterized protein LOC111516088 [Leptinotarsa decemlineata]